MTVFACLAPNTVVAAAIAPAWSPGICRAVLSLPAWVLPPGPGSYAILLALTLLLEAPAYLWLGRRARRSRRHGALMLLGANLATHPAVIYAVPPLAVALNLTLGTTTLLQEGFAVAVEAAVLAAAWRLSLPWAFAGSLLANLASWWLGVLVLA